MKKKCSKCGEVKSHKEFYNNKAAKDGKFAYCKQCSCIERREWYRKNPQRANELARKYRLRNPERYKLLHKISRDKRKGQKKLYDEKYRAENILKKKSIDKKYYNENKEFCKKKEKLWRTANKKWMNEKEKRKRKILDDRYVKRRLREGIPNIIITDQIINLKREAMILYRNLKKLKEAQNESDHLNR